MRLYSLYHNACICTKFYVFEAEACKVNVMYFMLFSPFLICTSCTSKSCVYACTSLFLHATLPAFVSPFRYDFLICYASASFSSPSPSNLYRDSLSTSSSGALASHPPPPPACICLTFLYDFIIYSASASSSTLKPVHVSPSIPSPGHYPHC